MNIELINTITGEIRVVHDLNQLDHLYDRQFVRYKPKPKEPPKPETQPKIIEDHFVKPEITPIIPTKPAQPRKSKELEPEPSAIFDLPEDPEEELSLKGD